MKLSNKMKFILRNSAEAIVSLTLVVFGYIMFKNLIYDQNPDFWIKQFYGKPIIIYLIYIGSEVIFGLFPPELFMLWAINMGDTTGYFLNLALLTAISLGAGHLAYYIGMLLSKSFHIQLSNRKFFVKYLPLAKKQGGLLIIIAALTPVPWSTISFIMGAVDYNYRKFTLYSLSRIFRFAVYGYIIFQIH